VDDRAVWYGIAFLFAVGGGGNLGRRCAWLRGFFDARKDWCSKELSLRERRVGGGNLETVSLQLGFGVLRVLLE
jgi:hypothetical protein